MLNLLYEFKGLSKSFTISVNFNSRLVKPLGNFDQFSKSSVFNFNRQFQKRIFSKNGRQSKSKDQICP